VAKPKAPPPRPTPTVSWSERVAEPATEDLHCHSALAVSSVECRDAANTRFVLAIPTGATMPAALTSTNGATVTFEVQKVTAAGTVMGEFRRLGGTAGSGGPGGIIDLSADSLVVTGALGADAVRRVVTAHGAELRACYAKGLSREPTRAGRLTIYAEIAANGTVHTTRVTVDSLHEGDVAACAQGVFQRIRFPAPGGFASVLYPVGFAPDPDSGAQDASPALSPAEQLEQDRIRLVVQASMGRVRYCYNTALLRKPALEGALTVHFSIASNGRVIDAAALDSTLDDAVMESCITTAFRAMVFPSRKAAFVADYPLRFTLADGATSPATP